MTATTILLILLSLVLAAGLSYYQYFYKVKVRTKTHRILALLRFITVFGILLLLINPVLSNKTYQVVKTPLPIVVDNSSSITDLKVAETVRELHQRLASNSDLKDKFDVQTYRFDSEFESATEFDFKGKQTNIESVAKSLKSLYKNTAFPTVLITDGNQTSGNDYIFSFNQENKVFPLVVGDTTTFLDLKVSQLNVNKYAFHKNKFPVEVFLNYAGTKTVNANFKITQDNSTLTTQSISFSPSKKSTVVNVLLPANQTGLQIFKASVTSSETEKNAYNNTKNFAVEVIDQKTNVAIITEINHPDIGALKRSIESNAQRKVTILKLNEVKDLSDHNVIVLYQPSSNFGSLFKNIAQAGTNTFIITGVSTDFSLLNQQQQNLVFKMSGQREDYLPEFNPQFNLFALDDIGFAQFPPLQHAFGTVATNGNVSVLLSSRIRNIETGMPLLAFAENQGKRSAFLLGENLWKWRMQSHIDTKSYEKFDVFIDKTVQYLASNNSRKSLVVNHESFYNSGEAIEITAQFFNKNYELDDKARLMISVINKNTKKVKQYDLLKSTNSFKVNLDGLSAGQYTFSVKELNTNTVYNGYFEILDFDIEKQFVNPDLNKLKQLATQTKGQVFMPNQTDNLIKTLLAEDNYKAIEKAIVKKTPLIDWVWLLILVAITLAAEWFLRKYNGML
ncbi:hypothetical protein G4D82_06675 [Flavobacterium sp. CYK-4]|uniref:hypothetical protein n=1 Tax=Flavobacterium lotistagni TaxID=2709660 RepID=UPI00140C351C|nr:hypothetical protein [Flavobacterium lotistagni]NHM06899.1 hypothetical protein [Flavobacterium lotistagni]